MFINANLSGEMRLEHSISQLTLREMEMSQVLQHHKHLVALRRSHVCELHPRVLLLTPKVNVCDNKKCANHVTVNCNERVLITLLFVATSVCCWVNLWKQWRSSVPSSEETG